MTFADISELSDLVEALAVVASLIYIGYQIKETRKSVRAATAQARTDLGVQLISSRYTSDIADVLVKSQSNPDALTKSERFKLTSFFSAHVRHCQNLYYQEQQGLLDEYFSFGVARVTAYWVRNYAWAVEEWEKVQKIVAPEFADYINSELTQHPTRYDA